MNQLPLRENSFAMKNLYLVIVLSLGLSSAFGQNFLIDTIYFEFDRIDLKEESKTQLDSIIGVFTSYPSYYVEVYGHTDSIGSERYNMELSEGRARSVALYLREQGISLQRITYEGLGTTKPVKANDTYAGRRKNRRADLAVIFSNEVITPVLASDTLPSDMVDIADAGPIVLVDTIYCDYDPFFINPSKRTVIIAPVGTKVIVEPNTFLSDAVEISMEVKELFNKKDMILLGMPSTSNEGPLEVTGMFSVNATVKGRPVKMNPDRPIAVELPASRRDAETALYAGSGGARGGSRSRRGKGKSSMTTSEQGFTPVRSWNREKTQVLFKGRDRVYTFDVSKPGRFAVGRPLYHSQNTDPKDKGTDIRVKLKGPRWEKTTNVMIVGEAVRTFIPLRKQDTRNYVGKKIKFLDPKSKLVLIGIQYDDRGDPWIAKRNFSPQQFIKDNTRKRKKKKKKKKSKKTTELKMKIKFRKTTKERLKELLTEDLS